jgi:Molybdopterin-binding domain of aldehyde dehydrogenase
VAPQGFEASDGRRRLLVARLPIIWRTVVERRLAESLDEPRLAVAAGESMAIVRGVFGKSAYPPGAAKTVIYVEPVAVMLSRKSGHPVKLVMSGEDVFKATGPTSGASMPVKIGAKRDGTIVAADGLFKLQAGAFPGSPMMSTCMCAFAPYDIPNARAIGYDVVSNRPKVAAYRAPGSPIAAYAVESILDVLAQKIGMDPRQEGDPDALWCQARARRICRDHQGVAQPSGLPSAARQQPGARRRFTALPYSSPRAPIL